MYEPNTYWSYCVNNNDWKNINIKYLNWEKSCIDFCRFSFLVNLYDIRQQYSTSTLTDNTIWETFEKQAEEKKSKERRLVKRSKKINPIRKKRTQNVKLPSSKSPSTVLPLYTAVKSWRIVVMLSKRRSAGIAMVAMYGAAGANNDRRHYHADGGGRETRTAAAADGALEPVGGGACS